MHRRELGCSLARAGSSTTVSIRVYRGTEVCISMHSASGNTQVKTASFTSNALGMCSYQGTAALSQAGSCPLCLRWQPQPFPNQAGCLGKAVSGSGSSSGGVTWMCQISSCSSGSCSHSPSYSMSRQISCPCHCSRHHWALQQGTLLQNTLQMPRDNTCNATSRENLNRLEKIKLWGIARFSRAMQKHDKDGPCK